MLYNKPVLESLEFPKEIRLIVKKNVAPTVLIGLALLVHNQFD